MSATIRQIVDDALQIVGEVAGAGVQQYEDDRMRADVVRAFNMMFKKRWWEQYRTWTTIALDGVLGIPTTDAFEQVKDFEDFAAVHRDKEVKPLPILSTRVNPASITTAGSRALFWTSLPATHANYAKRKILVYPPTATGNLNVLARVYPLVPPAGQFAWDQVFYLDRDMLAYATAFMTLASEDLNAGAADVTRNLMEMRYKDVVHALGSHPIPVSLGSDVPQYWQERV